MAKEVGLTHVLRSNVVVIVTTGGVGDKARRYANKIMSGTNLCIVMVDGSDLRDILASAPAIVDVLSREARQAMRLKPLDCEES